MDADNSPGVKSAWAVRRTGGTSHLTRRNVRVNPGRSNRDAHLIESEKSRIPGGHIWHGKSPKPRKQDLQYATGALREQVESIIEQGGMESLYFAGSSSMTIVSHGNEMEGYLSDGGAEYVFRTIDDDWAIWTEVDRSVETERDNEGITGSPSFGEDSKQGTTKRVYSNDAVVRVMVVYTAPAKSYVGNMYTNANMLVAGTNLAMSNSGTTSRLELAHVMAVDYSEPTVLPSVAVPGGGFCHASSNVGSTLVDVRCRLTEAGEGILDEVHVARHIYHADYVVLVTARTSGGGFSGAANTGAGPPSAFMVISLPADATYRTFAHETGHIFGASHGASGMSDPVAHYAIPLKECSDKPSITSPRGFQTIMWQGQGKCNDGSVTEKIQVYSNQAPGTTNWFLVTGPSPWCTGGEQTCVIDCLPVGDPDHDVTRLLTERQQWGQYYRANISTPTPLHAISSYSDRIVCPPSIPECGEELDNLAKGNPDHAFKSLAESVLQVYPNPINPTTGIRLNWPDQMAQVRIEIWDLLGRKVAEWNASEIGENGMVYWNGKNDTGTSLPTGVYIIRANDGNTAVTQNISLIR